MTILLALNFLISNFQTDKLIKVEVTDNISMSVPSDFRPMTDDEIASKYFTTRRPLALFTDRNLLVDLGVNIATTQWDEKDFEIMMSFQKANIFSLYDEVKILDEGIKEVNGKKAAYFEFISTVKDDEDSFLKKGSIHKYTYIQYIMVSGKSLVFNFTCPSQYTQQWQATASQIMNDIEIKGKIK